ncbi:MAG: DUF975 family protein [Kiritimatiellia bacterium]|nr:DUF975 family protein [Kiritimatiellia bacterium]
MEWYYAKAGQQNGPVDDAVLADMIRTGSLGPKDLVWKETFGEEWRAIASVTELSGFLGSDGAARQTSNGEILRHARSALSGKWGISIGLCLLYILIITVASGLGMGIASLFIMGPMMAGLSLVFLVISRGTQLPSVQLLFEGFSRFGSSLGLFWLIVWMTFLWSLLAFAIATLLAIPLVIGLGLTTALQAMGSTPDFSSVNPIALGGMFLLIFGIPMIVQTVVQLRYAMAFFVLADRPDIGSRGALRESIEQMRGNKGRLFCLYLRIFGLSLLCLLTCGIGYLWLFPYTMAAQARFYDETRRA